MSSPRHWHAVVGVAAGGLSIAIALWLRPAHAADVLYRCTDASGQVIWQNRTPCAKGHAQEQRRIEVPTGRAPPLVIPPVSGEATVAWPPAPTAPVPAARDTTSPPVTPLTAWPAASQDTPPAPVVSAEPPPPLYRCRRWDGETLLQESATPTERCAPLATTGLDGDARGGAGSACETVHDTCTPVPAEALCATWKNRVDEARFRWRYAGDGPQASARKAEYDALFARYEASTCVLAPKNQ